MNTYVLAGLVLILILAAAAGMYGILYAMSTTKEKPVTSPPKIIPKNNGSAIPEPIPELEPEDELEDEPIAEPEDELEDEPVADNSNLLEPEPEDEPIADNSNLLEPEPVPTPTSNAEPPLTMEISLDPNSNYDWKSAYPQLDDGEIAILYSPQNEQQCNILSWAIRSKVGIYPYEEARCYAMVDSCMMAKGAYENACEARGGSTSACRQPAVAYMYACQG